MKDEGAFAIAQCLDKIIDLQVFKCGMSEVGVQAIRTAVERLSVSVAIRS